MLFDNNANPNESYETRVTNNIGPVTISGGQKAGFVAMMSITGVLSIGIIPSIVWITKKNWINQQQIKINEAASTIEVQLQERFDLLNKLVDSVKGQMKFDQETLTAITAYRSGNAPKDITAKSATIDKISNGINMAFEAYPELGADRSVAKLMNECSIIEREIAAARRNYNAQVTNFNQTIFTFPTNYVAAKMGCVAINVFAANPETRKDVKIDLK